MVTFRAEHFVELMRIIALDITGNKELLTRLDAAAGDGDLGVNMELGFCTIWKKLDEDPPADLSTAFYRCGTLFNQAAPSTLGTILSSVFFSFASSTESLESLDRATFVEMMEKAMAEISELGGARPGDKTILDSMLPFTNTLKGHLKDPGLTVWSEVARKTEEAAQATAEMVSRAGRARMYGEKSKGVCAGRAVVFAIIARALGKYFTV